MIEHPTATPWGQMLGMLTGLPIPTPAPERQGRVHLAGGMTIEDEANPPRARVAWKPLPPDTLGEVFLWLTPEEAETFERLGGSAWLERLLMSAVDA